MFTADAHCDTLYAIALNRLSPDQTTVNAQRLAAGDVRLQTFAMFAADEEAAEAVKKGEALFAEADRAPVPLIRGDLGDTPPASPMGVLSIEGGEMLGDSLSRLAEMDDQIRIRLIALTWNYENGIGYPANGGSTRGLKPFGIALLREMDRRGILPDVSHLNVAGFYGVCEHAALPPVASHSDCRWLCDVPRNLYRDQVKAIIDRGGFIGVNFYSAFLAQGRDAVLEDVYRHIDEICQMGGEDVVGFGSDFDGIEKWPEGLATPADFPALLETLSRRGYGDAHLQKLAGLNYWNLLKRAQAARHV